MFRRHSIAFLLALTLGLLPRVAHAQATTVSGVYTTGIDSSGMALSGASQDPNWKLTYMNYVEPAKHGTRTVTNTYSYANAPSAYVVDAANNSSTDFVGSVGWSANVTSSPAAQWITVPGAYMTTSSTGPNTGGAYYYGYGTGSTEGIYIYTLKFTIAGTGAAGTPVSNVSLSFTTSADDQFYAYLNPSGNGSTLPSASSAVYHYVYTPGSSPWANTTVFTMDSTNSNFVIGDNYLVFVVDNIDSQTSSTVTGTGVNATGLFVSYISGTINGTPVQVVVPEVGTWIPAIGAILLYGLVIWRRRRSGVQAADAA